MNWKNFLICNFLLTSILILSRCVKQIKKDSTIDISFSDSIDTRPYKVHSVSFEVVRPLYNNPIPSGLVR
jgi:hypothetical protein